MFHFLLTSIFLCGLLKVNIHLEGQRSAVSGDLKYFSEMTGSCIFLLMVLCSAVGRILLSSLGQQHQRHTLKIIKEIEQNTILNLRMCLIPFQTFEELCISNILWGTDILASNYLACTCSLHSDFYYQIIRVFLQYPSCLGSFSRMEPHLNRAGQRTLSYPSLLTEHSTFLYIITLLLNKVTLV